MPQTPKTFADVGALRSYLASTEVRDAAERFLSRPRWPLTTVVEKSVEQTTFRAFSLKRWGARPSAVYRRWGNQYFAARIANFLDAPDAHAYQLAIDAAVACLGDAWREATRGEFEIEYGRAAKLVNLTLKHFVLLDRVGDDERRTLHGKLHVALDRFTLAPIADLAPEMSLGRTPSMGSVKTRNQYLRLQHWIANVCADAGVPPIYYEVATFDSIKLVSDPSAVATDLGVEHRPSRTNVTPKTRGIASPSRSSVRVSPPAYTRREPPRTDRRAEVIRYRNVSGAVVLRAERASYRGAQFSGAIELADANGPLASNASGAGRRVNGKVSWYGWIPQSGFAKIWIDGNWSIEQNYTGDVVDMLARPEFLSRAAEG